MMGPAWRHRLLTVLGGGKAMHACLAQVVKTVKRMPNACPAVIAFLGFFLNSLLKQISQILLYH